MFRLNTVGLLVILLMSLVVLGTTRDSLFADDDLDRVAQLKGWNITVSPASSSYGGEITVDISGLPNDFPFDLNAVTLGGLKVHVPSKGMGRLERPRSDGDGRFAFKSNVPIGLKPGRHYLKVDIRNIFVARTPFDFKPLILHVNQSEIVPFQEVWVTGTGFTTALETKFSKSGTVPESKGGTSGVAIGAGRVSEPYIDFPVELGRAGSLFFKMVVPKFDATTSSGEVELRVSDSGGKQGVATLTVRPIKLDLANYVSYPGENVPFVLTGLPARRDGFKAGVEMRYGYRIDWTGAKHVSVPLGIFDVDDMGEISGRFDIPDQTLLSSANKIWVNDPSGGSFEFNHYLAGRSVSSEPPSGLPGDSIRVFIKGMDNNKVLRAGAVYIGGAKVDIPGWFGVPGSKPVSDSKGFVTFETTVPNALQPGYRTMIWDAPGGQTASMTFYVRESYLYFDPPSVVPGQMVTMSSEALGVTTSREGVSGSGDSYVFINGLKQLYDVVDYPIRAQANGSFTTTFKVPVNEATAAKSSVEFTTVDTTGRYARGTLYLKRESVTVTPTESVRGTKLTVEGSGFFSNIGETDPFYRVLISYDGVSMGSITLDESGAFKTSLVVPATAAIGAVHQVSVVLEGWPSIKVDSNHRVPERAIQVTPISASPGESILVTGTGFDSFRQVTIGVGHLWANNVGLPTYTDRLGGFEALVEVPRSLPKGSVDLKVYAAYPVEVASSRFQVR
jgi:hypothetical protein